MLCTIDSLYGIYYFFTLNVVEHTLNENIKNKYLWKVTGNSKLPYS